MALLKNKLNLAAVPTERQEERPTKNQSRDTTVPGIHKDFITQVSEEKEGRLTTKWSQEFNRTESRFLSALSNLDEFPLKPRVRVKSGTVPGTSRNSDGENQQPNEDRSQIYSHPKVGTSVNWSPEFMISDPDDVFYSSFGEQVWFSEKSNPFALS